MIDFTPEQEQAIGKAARRRGTTPELLVMSVVEQLLAPVEEEPAPDSVPARSLADRLAPHVGVLDSGELIPGGARLSERRKEYAELLMRDHLRGRP